VKYYYADRGEPKPNNCLMCGRHMSGLGYSWNTNDEYSHGDSLGENVHLCSEKCAFDHLQRETGWPIIRKLYQCKHCGLLGSESTIVDNQCHDCENKVFDRQSEIHRDWDKDLGL